MKSRKSTSRYFSLILRHHPEVIGISLDEQGWADVNALIKGVSRTHFLDQKELEKIVREDEKQRYSFNEDHTKIRANQGHSIHVDVGLETAAPPEVLYHGSAVKYEESIDSEGLLPKSRLYVHLSPDEVTARKVGSRHGRPLVYRVNSGRMHMDGYSFYLSENHVWLTEMVPAKYLEKLP